jgi:LEA14-like dessication related protein
VLAVVGMAGLGGGCATLGRAAFREPVVTVQSVAVTGVSLTGSTLEVVLQVANPNRFALDAPGVRYRVEVDTVPVAAGELTERFRVPGRDSAVVRLPLSVSFRGLGAAGRSLLMSGTVPYRVRGALTVATPIGSFTQAFDRAGQFSAAPRR